MAEPIQIVSTSIEEDIEMAIQSDDEYDTPKSCAQLADLMAHTLAPASNHDIKPNCTISYLWYSTRLYSTHSSQ